MELYLDMTVQSFLNAYQHDFDYKETEELILGLDRLMQDAEFTEDIITKLVASLAEDYTSEEMQDFLGDLIINYSKKEI